MNATITIDTKAIPAPVMDAHCRTLLNCIGKFFECKDVQRDYERWYTERYGHPPREASYMKNEG